ncbi:unnamed protein product [Calypogeia fissa]
MIMLPVTISTIPNICSLPAAAIPQCRSSSYGGKLRNRINTVSHGGVVSCRHHQVRFSLHENETSSEPRGPSSEAELGTSSSTTIPVGVVGEQEKNPLAKSQGEGINAPTVGTEDGGSVGNFVGVGRLGDLSLLQTRRFWLGTSVGFLAALGGNLGGLTSSIFNLNPAVSRRVRADLLFPVKGFKRCMETSQGFEFIYPMSWVGDQRLLYRAVERAERERSLDLPPIQRREVVPRRASSGDPIVAFGPPGTDGALNVSVVVAPVYSGFRLQEIGGPQEAGERILKQFIAPEGSKKVATLLNAQQRTVDDQLYYYLEYSVKGPTFFRHNLSVYTTSSGMLYSLNAQTPESDWVSVKSDFGEIANSFKLLR